MFFRRKPVPVAQLALVFDGTAGERLELASPAQDNVQAALEFERVIEEAKREAAMALPLRREVRTVWKNYPVTAGRAFIQESVICLSRKLLTTRERVRDTWLHEYAHLYVFEKHGRQVPPHGREWRAAMLELGLTPKATHDYECERRRMPRPYACACERCGLILQRTRPLKRNREYHHIGCGGRIRSKGRVS
jgi:predicted SprT family Zn-dependent metalloprotease